MAFTKLDEAVRRDSSFTYRQVLLDLYEQFPDGFKSLEANRFLDKKYGRVFSYSPPWPSLIKAGYLTQDAKRTEKHTNHIYKVSPSVLKENEHDDQKPHQRKFLESFLAMEGITPLEEAILSNTHFIERMAQIKVSNLKLYTQMGGNYLDALLEASKD